MDVCALLRRDHDDIDRAFVAMVDPATSPIEQNTLVDIVMLALAVHSAAEAKVMETLVARKSAPPILGLLAMQSRQEHIVQRAAAEELTRIRPSSIRWYDKVLETRMLVRDHAARADYFRSTLVEHVLLEHQVAIAAEYATERMRLLGTTSPLAVARQREHRALVM